MRLSFLAGTAAISFLSLTAAVPSVTAHGTLISLTTRRDMVFDHAGKYLYISTSAGEIQRYELATGHLDSPYNLGGYLNGLDISADDSFILVAQKETGVVQGTFHKLDLSTGVVTNIPYTRDSGEAGGWDVAIASNNYALVTTQFGGSGNTPLRQIDLATNAVTIRPDVPTGIFRVRQDTHIARSADRTRLYFLEANTSGGGVFTYSATTNTFGPQDHTGWFLDTADSGVNRNGTLLGTRVPSNPLWMDTAPNFTSVHTFNEIDNGVAFDALRDVVYGGNGNTDEIVGYDTATFAEVFRTKVSEGIPSFGSGAFINLVASQDSRYLALATASGIRLIPTAATGTANLANISTRLAVQTGDNVLIGGFIITGTDPKQVVIRAIGPSLANSGLPDPLQNPILELHEGTNNGIIASNDDWQSAANANDIPPVLRPSDSQESVILTTLQPGAYTAVVSGSGNMSGTGLVEVYDIDPTANSRLANVSTRGYVQSGNDVMIGGIISQGGDGISKVVVRAIGPSLAVFGINDTLVDPILELRDGNGGLITRNNNWKDTQQAALEATGLAPANDLESAVLATLPAGNYTAIVQGEYAASGVGLVEIYDLD